MLRSVELLFVTLISIVLLETAPKESITSTKITVSFKVFRGKNVFISDTSRKSLNFIYFFESEAEPSRRSFSKSCIEGKKLKEKVKGLSTSSHPTAFIVKIVEIASPSKPGET